MNRERERGIGRERGEKERGAGREGEKGRETDGEK